MAILVQYANGVPGVKFLLDKPEVTIGRGLENDISIDDEFVSKRHAVIQLIEDELTSRVDYILIDNDSTNHTYVNNAPITAHRLDEEDKIVIGGNEFRFLSESLLSAELGRSQFRFFDDDAPGLTHPNISTSVDFRISQEELERANLPTTRLDDESSQSTSVSLEGYDVDELPDTSCLLNLANSPLDISLDTQPEHTKEKNLQKKNNKRFSRRLSLL